MSGDHNMNQKHDGVTLQYEHIKLDGAYNLNIGGIAYQIKPPPPVIGYWVLPCQDTQYKTMFAAYSKPNWFHRKMMGLVLGMKWEDVK